MSRVLRPGGRLVVLELSQPRRPPLSTFYAFWFDRLVPRLGTVFGNSGAYTYLPESVKRFPGPEALAAQINEAGFGEIRWLDLAGGIVSVHSATKTMNVSRGTTVPAPVTQVMDLASGWIASRMAAVEDRLGELV